MCLAQMGPSSSTAQSRSCSSSKEVQLSRSRIQPRRCQGSQMRLLSGSRSALLSTYAYAQMLTASNQSVIDGYYQAVLLFLLLSMSRP